jgi:hypothetical protein
MRTIDVNIHMRRRRLAMLSYVPHFCNLLLHLQHKHPLCRSPGFAICCWQPQQIVQAVSVCVTAVHAAQVRQVEST